MIPAYGKRPSARTDSAFTIIEVTLMIGIVVFTLLPMIGLLVMGKDSARKTLDRTRAVLIAEAIFADLRTSTASGLRIQVEPDTYNTNLNAENCDGQEAYLIYDDKVRAFAAVPSVKYEAGWDSIAGGAETMVKIAFEKPDEVHEPMEGETSVPSDLFLVTVSVEAPVIAPIESRRKEEFHALMVLTDER